MPENSSRLRVDAAVLPAIPRYGQANTLTSTSIGLTMSLDTSSLTVTEGDPIIATFTVTNNTCGTVTPQFYGGAALYAGERVSSGDSSGPTNASANHR